MARQTTTVSIVASAEYKMKLKLLALSRNVREGDLVREALDKYLGDSLENISLTSGVSQSVQDVR